jgi:outer membrane receptor protein involved in Fe transport
MRKLISLKFSFAGIAFALVFATCAFAENFDIPSGDLKAALSAYTAQTGVALLYLDDEIKAARTKGAKGDLSADNALARILENTGFRVQHESGALAIVRSQRGADEALPTNIAAASASTVSAAALETVTVTSSKIGGDVQNIPISITALSQEQLTATQTAGGPDLIKQVPNMTFTKTNFSGYSIQLRGIGTQAISVTTDPAVAVAFNDIPFIRNHFFEQEFYDVSSVQVLRGPQGTLYGRNATAGVVNLESAKPTDQFEAMASADIGNYGNRRLEGMINVPIVDDRADLRIAGEWTKRQGYSFDTLTNDRIDGRDLWSGRVTLGLKPTEKLQAYLIWEHFSEDDDRMRTAKQLCKTDPAPTSVDGASVIPGNLTIYGAVANISADYLSQGCQPVSLYSPDAFEVPNGFSLPYVVGLGVPGAAAPYLDPYASTVQSRNLRVIESAITPHYQAKNDTLELNGDYAFAPALTFTSQTGYNRDFLWSAEDYNRFNTAPGIFCGGCGGGNGYTEGVAYAEEALIPDPAAGKNGVPSTSEIFCDPQLGCSDRIVAEDLSDEHAWQLSQEFRLSSNFSGPFNFSVGGNYLHYETEENYYVFINALSLFAWGAGNSEGTNSDAGVYIPGVSDNSQCLKRDASSQYGYQNPNPIKGGGQPTSICVYIDPNPITSLNNHGHNYFLSQNPYTLNSYAGFGEAYYNITSDLKLTGGLRWTEDRKHFVNIPSEVVTQGYGYPITSVVDQQWDELTGRAVANWTPKLDFTDQTLIYGSYSRGYKAGGANPPGAVLDCGACDNITIAEPVHPLTFKPEFINAFELGSKNTLLDGALTLNGDVFYYDYKEYQISEIVDRTSINLNFNATVKGAELEATWEPSPGLRFNFAGGYEDTRIDNGQSSIDLMDRTDSADHPGWMVVKPFVTETSNCIFPDYVVAALLEETISRKGGGGAPLQSAAYACAVAYEAHLDPGTLAPYVPNPSGLGGTDYPPCINREDNACAFPIPNGYAGFDPTQPAINNGEGFAKDLSGNKLPNAPPFTVSFGAQYTLPLSTDWAGTVRGDYYWQDYSWARVFNDNLYDRLRGYTNVNLTLIFTNQNGWQVMLYDKNVFNTTAITGDFLNSDDSGLTTNVFLTDPKLIGIRVTKNW